MLSVQNYGNNLVIIQQQNSVIVILILQLLYLSFNRMCSSILF